MEGSLSHHFRRNMPTLHLQVSPLCPVASLGVCPVPGLQESIQRTEDSVCVLQISQGFVVELWGVALLNCFCPDISL